MHLDCQCIVFDSYSLYNRQFEIHPQLLIALLLAHATFDSPSLAKMTTKYYRQASSDA
jgi:hypothetical protein